MILGNTQEFASPEEALVHFGVKGMKWGVRKEGVRGGGPKAHIRISNKTNAATVSGANIAAVVGTALIFVPAVPLMFLSPRYRAETAAATRQNRKVQGDKKFKKAIENSQKAARVHNMAAKEINAQLPAFNGDKRWKGMTPDSPKQKAYDAAVEKELLNPEYAKAAVKVYGSESPTGRYKFEIDSAEKGTLKFRDTLKEAHEERQKVEHADDDEELVEVGFEIVRNSTGHILGFKPDSKTTAMAQSAIKESVNILEHHGVKGMRWGVRKEEDPGGKTAARVNADTKREMSTGLSISSSGRVTSIPTPTLTKEKATPQLGSEAQAKQARVDAFLKRSDVMDTRISELKARNEALAGSKDPIKAYEKYGNAQTIKQFEKAKKTALKDAEAVHKGKMTSKQKQVVVGALAVGGLLAGGYLAGKYVQGSQSGALNSYRLLARQRLTGQKTPFNINKELTGPMSAKDLLAKVAKPVNPLYSSPGGQMNCRRSTYTYELRRRGFDVRATTSAVGWGQSESGVINAVTKDGKDFFDRMSMSQAVVDTGFSSRASGDTRVNPLKKILLDGLVNEKPSFAEQARAIRENGGRMPEHLNQAIRNAGRSNSAKVLEELAKQPNGARGEVVFKFPQFGHSMAYEVVDGVPHIFDSQKGTLYNSATKMVESKWDGFHSAEITRLDNVDLDTNFLTRWATNAKKAEEVVPERHKFNLASVLS